MSIHTDMTDAMVKRFKRKIYNPDDSPIRYEISKPHNKDKRILDDINYKTQRVRRYAARFGYKLQFTLDSTNHKPTKFNCGGCRKRRSGDYFWVTGRAISKKKDHDSWDQPLCKVCSKECGELMILRLA